MSAPLRCLAVLLGALLPASALADDFIAIPDPVCDHVARRTDPGGDGPFDPSLHRLPDLLEMAFGNWLPNAPESDLFNGVFESEAEFLRFDILFDGLVNPPGRTDPSQFAPFAYGDHPVYGFIEIDMDDDMDTGGELETPQFRYLGNVVRFGGMPDESLYDGRVAEDASAFDGDFLTEPYVERHGEEFHIALLGGQFFSSDVVEIAGDGDGVFEAGETWDITAPWFHRAHGFEPFSLAKGGPANGEYAPDSVIRFRHDPVADTTRLSLVFPLTNEAAALIHGEPPEPLNHNPTDQASVLEALSDLVDSAEFLDMFPTGLPEEAIIIDWKDKDPEEFLSPAEWRVTALVGSTYIAPDPAGVFFVWTDANPDVLRGDVDGENGLDADDVEEIVDFIAEHDADDGSSDGAVTLVDFAVDFSVFDVNHNGIVNYIDVMLVSLPGDHDDDGDVDFADFQAFQVCFSGTGVTFDEPACALADLDADGDVDLGDFKRFQLAITGP